MPREAHTGARRRSGLAALRPGRTYARTHVTVPTLVASTAFENPVLTKYITLMEIIKEHTCLFSEDKVAFEHSQSPSAMPPQTVWSYGTGIRKRYALCYTKQKNGAPVPTCRLTRKRSLSAAQLARLQTLPNQTRFVDFLGSQFAERGPPLKRKKTKKKAKKKAKKMCIRYCVQRPKKCIRKRICLPM